MDKFIFENWISMSIVVLVLICLWYIIYYRNSNYRIQKKINALPKPIKIIEINFSSNATGWRYVLCVQDKNDKIHYFSQFPGSNKKCIIDSLWSQYSSGDIIE